MKTDKKPDKEPDLPQAKEEPDAQETRAVQEAAASAEPPEAPDGENSAADPSETDSAPVQETADPDAEASAGEPGDNSPAPSDDEQSRISRLIAEAENRGYIRGRNESIEQLMRRPGMMERMPEERESEPSGGEPMILSRRRISIWDR